MQSFKKAGQTGSVRERGEKGQRTNYVKPSSWVSVIMAVAMGYHCGFLFIIATRVLPQTLGSEVSTQLVYTAGLITLFATQQDTSGVRMDTPADQLGSNYSSSDVPQGSERSPLLTTQLQVWDELGFDTSSGNQQEPKDTKITLLDQNGTGHNSQDDEGKSHNDEGESRDDEGESLDDMEQSIEMEPVNNVSQ